MKAIHKFSQIGGDFQMTDDSLRIGLADQSVMAGDGFRYRLTKQFFYLYVYLAYEKLKNSLNVAGFAEIARIRHLPFWEKNNTESIGKQIRRHIIRMEAIGRNIIEAQQRIKGPFRLRIAQDHIFFDSEDESIRSFLGLDRLVVFYSVENEATFYEYMDGIVEGDIFFNEGGLESALTSFRNALEKATTRDQRVTTLLRIGRVLDRLGEYREAIKVYESAEEMIKASPELNYYDLASLLINLALAYYRQGKPDLAYETFFRARDLIGERRHDLLLGRVYNGIGIIHQAAGRYMEAIGFFKTALSLETAESNFYDISAAYFNIGNAYKRMADELPRTKRGQATPTMEARALYKQAINWAKRCIDITRQACLGDETAQDRILTAYCHYKLGEYKKALTFAEEARAMSATAGNKRDLALSFEVLGSVFGEMGEDRRSEAEEALKKSLEYFRAIENELGVRRIMEIQERLRLCR
jgi:tetratricopeptide (TPR) repeat protein